MGRGGRSSSSGDAILTTFVSCQDVDVKVRLDHVVIVVVVLQKFEISRTMMAG